MIKIAINGYGRIGRNVLRALYESGRDKTIKIVAINELAAPEAMVHLTRYDTSHGRFHHPVQLAGNSMLVGEDLISLFAERDPSKLPWRALGVDVVLDCTGVFGSRADAELHLAAGRARYSSPIRRMRMWMPPWSTGSTIIPSPERSGLSPTPPVPPTAWCR